MRYDYKGWWINDASQYLSNYRMGSICVTYSKSDVEKMFKDLPKLITSSDIDQYAYGTFLFKNYRNNDDLKKVLAIAKNLMNNGNVLGNYLYAHLIFDGVVLQKIESIAVQHLERVLRDIPDFAPALYNLGYCYYYGNGVNKNTTLAMQYINKAKDLGLNSAINYVGLCYYNGKDGYPQDYQKALECFKESSFKGDEKGYFYLATLYALGKGCPRDYQRAVECYSLAGTKGHIDSAYNAGRMYFFGTQVAKNIGAAAYSLEIAAKGDKVEAMYLLSLLYLKESEYYYKKDEGIEWLKKACKLGYEDAIKLANKMNIRY